MTTAEQQHIDTKAEQRRQQQHHADQRPPTKLLLTDHRLVGFQRQHLIVATDHHRHAEIGDGQGEHQAKRQGRQHQPALGPERLRQRREPGGQGGDVRRRRLADARHGAAVAR